MPQMSQRTRSKRQRGQAMVETALVITNPGVYALVFTIDMGRLLLIQQWVGERTRWLRPELLRSTTRLPRRSPIIWSTTTPQRQTAGGAGYLGLLTT